MKNFTVKQLVLFDIAILAVCVATFILGVCSLVIASSTLAVNNACEYTEEVVYEVSVEVMDEDPFEAEKIEEALLAQGYYRDDIPLSYVLQDILLTVCEDHGIPYEIALGLIDVESDFRSNVVSQNGCYGLCQLNPKYFPSGLSDEDNIRTGIAYLGKQLDRYDGDMDAALTAYNAGHDTGKRSYAAKVKAAADYWSKED